MFVHGTNFGAKSECKFLEQFSIHNAWVHWAAESGRVIAQ